MAHANFVHLRVYSAYSLLEGAVRIQTLIEHCRQASMPAVAVTDRGNLFGLPEFTQAALQAGVQPIAGCLLALDMTASSSSGKDKQALSLAWLPLLVQDAEGYRNLLWLMNRYYLKPEPHLTLSELEQSSQGLIALTGGPQGPLGYLLQHRSQRQTLVYLERFARLFDRRLYVELMRHSGEIGKLEHQYEPDFIDLADRFELPLVATNDCFFADQSMYQAHDALLCIPQGCTLEEPQRRRVSVDHYLKSPQQMTQLFADLPEAIANTLVIARRCSMILQPKAVTLPPFTTQCGKSQSELLCELSKQGLETRLAVGRSADAKPSASIGGAAVTDIPADEPCHPVVPDLFDNNRHHHSHERNQCTQRYQQRLDYELAVIEQMGFAGYFLIVADIISWAKRQGIPVGPGRGSGAGSLVAWALNITEIDPIAFGLLFEHFLNPERVSPPDLDVDFCHERRDEVIWYVKRRYGEQCVAQIIALGTLQPKLVLRDIGRVLRTPVQLVNKLCRLIPQHLGGEPPVPVTLQNVLDRVPELQRHREQNPQLFELALKVEGLYRHTSTHAAGVVIAASSMDKLVPLYRDPRTDSLVIQFTMEYVEYAGLIKFDFLGLKTLTMLQSALEMSGQDIDLNALALDDPLPYQLLCRAETLGVFQLEGDIMRKYLKELKPDRIEDITAIIALYRPGPMKNIKQYIASRHGHRPPKYLHPKLEALLEETFGILVYQEQVIRGAQLLAGYSPGQAGLLRRAMAKKNKEEMDKQESSFITGAANQGLNKNETKRVFAAMAKFAGYGFSKSHAVAYAVLSYQTAWMKAHYPAAFLASAMTQELANTDKLELFRQEVPRLGIQLLPPDINRSYPQFRVEQAADGKQAIRYALAALKGVGETATKEICLERDRHGRFTGVDDLVRRVAAVNRQQLENLIAAGAFDQVHPNRAQLTLSSAELLRAKETRRVNRSPVGQDQLFQDHCPAVGSPSPDLSDIPDWDLDEKSRREFKVVGFHLTVHPLEVYGPLLDELGLVGVDKLCPGSRQLVAGIILGRQMRSGKRIVKLSAPGRNFEVRVFSEKILNANRQELSTGCKVILTVERQDEPPPLTAHKIVLLEQLLSRHAGGLRIWLHQWTQVEAVEALADQIRQLKSGCERLQLVVVNKEQGVTVNLPGLFNLKDFEQQLQLHPAVDRIEKFGVTRIRVE